MLEAVSEHPPVEWMLKLRGQRLKDAELELANADFRRHDPVVDELEKTGVPNLGDLVIGLPVRGDSDGPVGNSHSRQRVFGRFVAANKSWHLFAVNRAQT